MIYTGLSDLTGLPRRTGMIDLLDYLPRPAPSNPAELAALLKAGDSLVLVTMYGKPMHVVVIPSEKADEYVKVLNRLLDGMGFGPEVDVLIGNIATANAN